MPNTHYDLLEQNADRSRQHHEEQTSPLDSAQRAGDETLRKERLTSRSIRNKGHTGVTPLSVTVEFRDNDNQITFLFSQPTWLVLDLRCLFEVGQL